jgi:hypothetical protein
MPHESPHQHFFLGGGQIFLQFLTIFPFFKKKSPKIEKKSACFYTLFKQEAKM